MINGKKVVFYNVSYCAIMEYKNIALNRIRNILILLQKNKYIIILWRPHPELKIKLKENNKELFDQYCDIEKYFVENKIGILDKSDSIEWAYKVSDIYYGDYGSVAEYFKILNKPVIYQKYIGRFFPIGLSYCDEYIYGTDHDNASILRFDIKKCVWEYVSVIQTYENYERAFHKSISYKGKIYFIPYRAKHLVEYECNTNQIKLIDLKLKSEYFLNPELKFYSFFIWNEKLYLIPVGYKKCISLNLKSYEICEEYDFSKYIDVEGKLKWLSWQFFDDNKVAMCSMCSNEIVILNLKSKEIDLYKIGDLSFRYNEIRMYKGAFYILDKHIPRIIKWDYPSNEYTVIKSFPKNINVYGKTVFDQYANTIYKNEFFCIPAKSDIAVAVNLDNLKVRELKNINKYIGRNKKVSQFDTVVVYDNKIYAQHQSYKFLIFDMETDKIIEAKCEISEEDSIKEELDLLFNLCSRG